MWLWLDQHIHSIYQQCLNNETEEVQEICYELDVINKHEHTLSLLKKSVRWSEDIEYIHKTTSDIHELEKKIETLRVQLILSFYMLQK